MVIKNKRSIDEILRAEIEKEYQDTANVSRIVSSKDPKTKETINKEVVLLSEIPCRLSFLNKEAGVSARGEIYDFSSQTIKLFTCPEYEIESGSRITVTHLGRVIKFECSSHPKTYVTHQEIELSVMKVN